MKLVRRCLIVALALFLAMALLPPLVANNFVFRDHLARKISKATGCRAEVVGFTLSSWTGKFKIDIPALDLYEAKEDGKMIMSLDYIHCEMYPWQIITPFFGQKNGSIRNVEWVRAVESFRAFAKDLPYLPLNFPAAKDDGKTINFQKVRFEANNVKGILNFHLSCDVECPTLSESSLTTRGRFDNSSRELFLDGLSFSGRSRSLTRVVRDGKIVEDVYDVPFTFVCDCSVKKGSAKFENISFMADKFLSTGSVLLQKKELSFLLNGSGELTPSLARLMGLTERVSYFDGLDGRVVGETKEGALQTEGKMAFQKGALCGVELEKADFFFKAVNDHVTSLALTSGFWHGSAAVTMNEKKVSKGSTLLKADLDLKGLLINDMLEHFKCRVRAPGGSCDIKCALSLTNGTLGAFLEGGNEIQKQIYGKGRISARDVELSYFMDAEWRDGKAPFFLQRLLSSGASIASAKEELPFLQQIMQSLGKEKLKNYSADFIVRNGAVESPLSKLSGKMGEVTAKGSCSFDGKLDYKLELKLNSELSNRYAKQPLASIFVKDGQIVIPVKMSGDLKSPKATLDLTEEKKAVFEDKVLDLVTEFYNDKLKGAASRILGEGDEEIMQKIENSVKELLKKLL